MEDEMAVQMQLCAIRVGSRKRVFIKSTAGFNERLEEILTIACSVGWGASYLLRSYYDGDLNHGNLEIQNKDGLTRYCC